MVGLSLRFIIDHGFYCRDALFAAQQATILQSAEKPMIDALEAPAAEILSAERLAWLWTIIGPNAATDFNFDVIHRCTGSMNRLPSLPSHTQP